ncbi:unnamed protein product [Aureobasidium vineae]|uniref:Replication protein n=1 Tax=Aureobasidium vineae TaxID=2773715 RepID=A0A9N8PCD8_9PEZI|nr:unnamed protein product [Aureobasidium vineae]
MTDPTRPRRKSFQEIASAKIEGTDYKILVKDRGSAIVIIAPHGGDIEPGTSQIAAAVAGDDLSLYDFQGLRNTHGHRELHLSSHLFDEPQALQLVERAETAVAIHGRKDGNDPDRVWIGGLDVQRCRRTMAELVKGGFGAVVREPGETLAGTAASNICNRSKRKEGIQLEIPKSLRDRLKSESMLRSEFARAINKGIREEALFSKY